MRLYIAALSILSVSGLYDEGYLVDCGTPGAACPASVVQSIQAAGGTKIKHLIQSGMLSYEAAGPVQLGGSYDTLLNVEVANFADELGPSISIAEAGGDGNGDKRKMRHGRRLNSAYPPNTGDDDFFFDVQWYHEAVGSKAAWDKGFTGEGVTVAVLDTGVDYGHPDLAPNLDFENSKSFVEDEPREYTLWWDVFSHGSHVAGMIAAADNGFGTIGIAPKAKILHVKVLSDYGSGCVGDQAELNKIKTATCKAVNYAVQKGSTVIVSGGNSGENMKGKRGGELVRLMGDCQQAVEITAAAPYGWAIQGDDIDLYRKASYSTYGNMDFAGPGGSVDIAYEDPDSAFNICQAGPLVRYCYVFDLAFSTGNRGWYWSAGTSMAAPGVAGVAALILSEFPGLGPSQLEAKLRDTAVNVGKNGKDEFYGHGHAHSGHFFDL